MNAPSQQLTKQQQVYVSKLRNLVPQVKLLLRNYKQEKFEPIKLALRPYQIQQEQYKYLGLLTQVWQKLIYKASKDDQLIIQTFKHNQKIQELISGLYNIFLKTLDIKYQKQVKQHQDSSLMLCRTDFIKNLQDQFKIVQYNITGTSFYSHSQQLTKLNTMINLNQDIIQQKLQKPANSQNNQQNPQKDEQKQLQNEIKNNSKFYEPDNTPLSFVCKKIASLYQLNNLKGIFLMLVNPEQTNIIDHQTLLLKLQNQNNIQVERVLFINVYENLRVDKNTNQLYYGQKNVSVVYYRTGLKLTDYYDFNNNSQNCWKVKQLIQLSNAIKIPNIRQQLVNMKRMQVKLSKQQIYTQYLNPTQSQILKKSLVFSQSLQQVQTNMQFMKYIQSKGVQNFILKPNFQGGGSNIFNENVYHMMKKLSIEECRKYIMMEKIKTEEFENFFIGDENELQINKFKAQISRYGAVLQINRQLKQNQVDGYLLRMKPYDFNQAGVISRIGGLGSISLKKDQNRSQKQQIN